MRRLFLPLLAMAVTRTADARPSDTGASGGDEVSSIVDRAIANLDGGVERIADWLAARDVLDDLVRVQIDVRDALRSAETWLVAWAGPVATPTANLIPLTASPVPEVESSGYGWRDDPMHGNRKFHKGTDFRAERGTPVHAAGDGVVAFCGWQHGYGRVIYVDHGGGVITRYAHLATIGVETGELVVAAAQIGEVGASGRATGPHLHFEIRIDGRAVDPVLAMQIAELQRTTPELAAVAGMALSPLIQDHALDEQDPTNRSRSRGDDHHGHHRPSGRRSDALW